MRGRVPLYYQIIITAIALHNYLKLSTMKTKDLIKSFMKQAQWGQNADDGRPFRGVKWLTVKQLDFLWALCKKQDPKGIDFFESFTWEVDGYKVELGKTAANGCASMSFTNLIGE